MEHKQQSVKDEVGAADFEIAYGLYSRRLYWLFYWRTRDQMTAEDLTTGAFEKAWQSRLSFHGGSLQAWLFRIARNLLIDYWRKKKALSFENIDDVADPIDDASEALDKKLMLQRLQSAIKQLPDTMRLVIELRYMDGLSAEQTAQRLHISSGNVRVIQHRALLHLRHSL